VTAPLMAFARLRLAARGLHGARVHPR
jgi:hypothetical protein